MRAYQILIFDTDGTVLQNWNTFKQDGSFDPNSLLLECDIPESNCDTPAGKAWIKIHGVGLQFISQAINLTGKTIKVFLGMCPGLPLANPSQYGQVTSGEIFQCFGNWIGIDQSIEIVIIPSQSGTNDNPVNLVFHWVKGQNMQTAITNTLKTAFPNKQINVNINQNLISQNTEVGIHNNIKQFAQSTNTLSKINNTSKSYNGVKMVSNNDSINVYDGTVKTGLQQINFIDLIGQPTWLSPATIQITVVLRADLKIGDTIKLPQTVITTTVQSNVNILGSNQNLNAVFSGDWLITSLRHVGSSRNSPGTAWVTVIEAVKN